MNIISKFFLFFRSKDYKTGYNDGKYETEFVISQYPNFLNKEAFVKALVRFVSNSFLHPNNDAYFRGHCVGTREIALESDPFLYYGYEAIVDYLKEKKIPRNDKIELITNMHEFFRTNFQLDVDI